MLHVRIVLLWGIHRHRPNYVQGCQLLKHSQSCFITFLLEYTWFLSFILRKWERMVYESHGKELIYALSTIYRKEVAHSVGSYMYIAMDTQCVYSHGEWVSILRGTNSSQSDNFYDFNKWHISRMGLLSSCGAILVQCLCDIYIRSLTKICFCPNSAISL